MQQRDLAAPPCKRDSNPPAQSDPYAPSLRLTDGVPTLISVRGQDILCPHNPGRERSVRHSTCTSAALANPVHPRADTCASNPSPTPGTALRSTHLHHHENNVSITPTERVPTCHSSLMPPATHPGGLMSTPEALWCDQSAYTCHSGACLKDTLPAEHTSCLTLALAQPRSVLGRHTGLHLKHQFIVTCTYQTATYAIPMRA